MAVVTNPGNRLPSGSASLKQIIGGLAVPFFRLYGTGPDHHLHMCLLAYDNLSLYALPMGIEYYS